MKQNNLTNGNSLQPAEDLIVLTMQEAAAKLKISIPTMYKLTKEPDFPAFRVGRGLRVRESMLSAWVTARAGGC